MATRRARRQRPGRPATRGGSALGDTQRAEIGALVDTLSAEADALGDTRRAETGALDDNTRRAEPEPLDDSLSAKADAHWAPRGAEPGAVHALQRSDENRRHAGAGDLGEHRR